MLKARINPAAFLKFSAIGSGVNVETDHEIIDRTSLVELKSGDEAYGLLASETDDELAIKDLTGLVTRYQKSDIAARTQLTTSIMPTGLTESLSAHELVDLVEFLQSLKVQ